MTDEELTQLVERLAERSRVGGVMPIGSTLLEDASSAILSLMRERRDAQGEADMANGAIQAVRELLASAGVPVAAFVDDHVGNAIVQRNAAVARTTLAETRLEKAVEALRPFAKHGEFVNDYFEYDSDDTIAAGLSDNPITLGDFRRARSILSEITEAKGSDASGAHESAIRDE